MNKTELIAVVAEKAEVTQKEAELVLTAMVDTIQENVTQGEKVVLTGFGTFELDIALLEKVAILEQDKKFKFLHKEHQLSEQVKV